MRRTSAVIASVVFAVLWFGAVPGGAAAGKARTPAPPEPPAPSAPLAAPAEGEVLKTLRKGHPRLVATTDMLEQVKKTIAADATAANYYKALKQSADQTLGQKPVEYIIVGPRLLSQSRRCLSRVAALSLMYRLSGDRRYADRAKQELFAAAAFRDWNPSHFLDTAEMTHAFALGYDWLYDYLTAEERVRIRTAIVEKGLKPSLPIYDNNRGWARSNYNWNQVCNGGMTIGALAIADEEPELAAHIVAAAIRSVPRAMQSYAPDGGWAEGPGYWSYATRYNVFMLAALDSALGTDFGLSQLPGFDKAGLFRIHSVGPIGLTFNFADAGDRAGAVCEMFWLARRFNQPIYAWHAREFAGGNPWELLWYDARGKGPKADGLPLDAYFRGIEVAFFRSAWEDRNAVYVGFKGGDNKANHGHLDLGSFVLDALGRRWAVDLGGDDYNLPAYFGNKRWTYFRLRTESHNTLVINGENQDTRAVAPIVAFGSKPERAFAVADLSHAYAPAVRRAHRGIALLERRHVLVQDELEADKPVEVLWGMLTPAKVALRGAEADLVIRDAAMSLRILEPQGAKFDTMSANPPKPQRQNPGITRLVVRLPGPVANARIAILMTPHPTDKSPEKWTGTIKPLAQWD